MKSTYCPYKKTFQFLHLQNQVSHKRNLQKVHSLTNSNVKIHPKTSFNNPKKSLKTQQSFNIERYKLGNSRTSNCNNLVKSISLIDPYRVLHMNENKNRKENRNRNIQNERLARKLCNSSCSVEKLNQTEKVFEKHLKYQEIAQRYDQGCRKNLLFGSARSTLYSSTLSKVDNSIGELIVLSPKYKVPTVRESYRHFHLINSRIKENQTGKKTNTIRLK